MGGGGEVFQFNFRKGQGPEEGAPHQGVGEPPQGFPGSSEIAFLFEFNFESKIESQPGPKLNSICRLFKVK